MYRGSKKYTKMKLTKKILSDNFVVSELEEIYVDILGKTWYRDFVSNNKTIKQEIKKFQEPNPKAIELIEKSFLSDDLKKQYITAYKFRCRMLDL